ncbi:MAG: aldo/keto reductase [Acidobacteriota bacterium]|jgi:predicted aldo/keto reductase-like oxidoreductase|nr:aldo/keto reductase [Acidobacteriota bacterium]
MLEPRNRDARTVLGKTGIEVCRMGFGGIPIQRLSFPEAEKLIAAALDAGIDFFDTSRIYTDSEAKLGRALAGRRDRAVIASKSYSRDAARARADLESSLGELKTDHVDIYQLHNVSTEADLERVLGSGGALEALDRAREQGLVRFIGITGHKPWILEKALQAYDFATIQVPVNIVEQSSLDKLIPYARARDIGIIAMKPVAGGALKNVKLNLRFILASGVDVAIPGMDAIEQVHENLSVLNAPLLLSIQERQILDNEKESLGDHFCRRCEYCMPCPEGLNIPLLHLMEGYYFRYNLKDWALERLADMAKTFSDCTACGVCVSRCPYELDMPGLFQSAAARIAADRKTRQA